MPQPEHSRRASTRRRKTATAFYESGRIVVLVPARLSIHDRQALADRLVDRLLNRTSRSVTSDATLEARAAHLADRHLGACGRPVHVDAYGGLTRGCP